MKPYLSAGPPGNSFRLFSMLMLLLGCTVIPSASFSQPRVGIISIQGNHAISTREILDAMTTKEGGVFRTEQIRADLQAVTRLYEAEGFLSTEVSAGSLGWNAESTLVDIRLDIREGEKSVLDSIVIEGNTMMTTDEISGLMETRKGGLLRQPVLEGDFARLVQHYEQRGRPFASISIERIEPVSASGMLRLYLTVAEGPPVKVDEIRVSGNKETKDNVILREAGIPLGEPYNSVAIERAARRLRRMNLFTSVAEPEVFLDDSGRGVVLFSVAEGNSNSFDGVLGYVPGSSASGGAGYATGMVNISMINLLGTARKLGFRWQKDDRFSQEISVRYSEPWVFNLPLDLAGSFLQRQQDTTYVSRATEFRGTVRLADQLTGGGIVAFDYVIPSATVGRVLPGSRTLSTGLEVSYDSRDEIVAPASGILYHTDYRIGTKRSDATALAPETRSTVQRIGLDGEAYLTLFQRQVVALGLHARQVTGGSLEISDLYRFGGASTLRGYRENQFLGSRAAWATVEYRLLLARRSFLFGFLDNGYYYVPDDSTRGFTAGQGYKMGYGIGIRLETGLGNIGVSFALGQGDPFSQGKVHIMMINSF